MRKRRTDSVVTILALVALVLFSSCRQPFEGGRGAVGLSLARSPRAADGGPLDLITRVQLKVTGPDMTDVIETLDHYNSSAGASLEVSVPAGSGRSVVVTAHDAAGTVLYSGQTLVEVVAGQELPLSMRLDAVPFSLSYELNGGSNSPDNPSSYTVESPRIDLAAPTRSGYSFAGWYVDAGFQTSSSAIQAASTGDRLLRAKWLWANSLSLHVVMPEAASMTILAGDAVDQGTDLVASLAETFDAYAWYLDGVPWGNGATIAINTDGLLGPHELIAVVRSGGEASSGSL
ncbi:MAG: InlB B-repeat-containing protein, partial [Spirochaetota bacterium]